MALIVVHGRYIDDFREEIEEAGDRAVSVGAMEPLSFVGMGATGIVFCGAEGHAWKCGRMLKHKGQGRDEKTRQHLRSLLRDEYEFLRDACTVGSIRRHIACPYGFDEDAVVIEREGPTPREGRVQESKLFDLYKRIRETMRPMGWAGLEFKVDSFVVTRERGPVFVDAGFGMRLGWNLVRYVEELVTGQRYLDPRSERPRDLVWNMKMDAIDGVIPMSVYKRMAVKVQQAFPEADWLGAEL
jgi:hypothetical protein